MIAKRLGLVAAVVFVMSHAALGKEVVKPGQAQGKKSSLRRNTMASNFPAHIPIACTLTPGQFQERKASLLHKIGQSVQVVQEQEHGYAYRFSADKLSELALVIEEERQCCPFLRFALIAEPGKGPVWLEVTGPAGTKEFIRCFFD